MRQLCSIETSSVRLAAPPLELLDFKPVAGDIRAEVLAGLSRPRKTLPCKLFYDERGSQLFDQICELPEYYPTRTELQIMRAHAEDIAAAVGARARLVEYGSGSSLKTRVLLDHLHDLAGYVPIDISRTHLLRAAEAIATRHPLLTVQPVCADYTRPFSLPPCDDALPPSQTAAYFPGSTIGNFEPDQALAFLKAVRATCGPGSRLLIGVDLKKDPNVLHAAYNDAAGVTAAFNVNLLRHVNREIGSDFDLDGFAHYAFYEPVQGRMEMHLVSRRGQTVDLGGATATFAEGESIHTESCHKYTPASFASLVGKAGYRCEAAWTDPRGWFSVQLLESVS